MNLKESEQQVSERFDILAQRENNWDGNDSKKPTKKTLVRAENLIGEWYDSIISTGIRGMSLSFQATKTDI